MASPDHRTWLGDRFRDGIVYAVHGPGVGPKGFQVWGQERGSGPYLVCDLTGDPESAPDWHRRQGQGDRSWIEQQARSLIAKPENT